jgi:hemerythrin
MAFIVWNDKLAVDDENMDNDHKEIVAMANQLYDAILAGHGKECVLEILDKLMDYAVRHFAREEELFTHIHFPDAEAHKREHNAMRIWVADLRERVKNGTAAAPSLEVMNMLKDWLFDHIVAADHKYAPYLVKASKVGASAAAGRAR